MQHLIAVLLPAIMAVESGGNLDAVGDNGRARGPYQIHRACWLDGTRALRVSWEYPHDAHIEPKARAVAEAYLAHYGRAYERREGRKVTPEVLARIWNGGPTGYKKAATKKYWAKIEKELKKQQKK